MPLDTGTVLLFIAIMASVTYLCRVLTLVLVRKKIGNRFLNSFLTYVPYAVLASMVFPGIFFSTSAGGTASGALAIATLAGTGTAVILAFFRRGLFAVSMSAVAVVLAVTLVLQAAGMP